MNSAAARLLLSVRCIEDVAVYHFPLSLFHSFIVCRKNVILTNVIEERTIQTRDYTYEPNISTVNKEMTVRRELGQAMIPGSRLVKVEIAKSIHDEKIGRILHNSNKLPINRPVV